MSEATPSTWGSAKPLRLKKVGQLKLGPKPSWTWGPLYSEADGGNLALRSGGSANGGLEESGAGSVTVTVDVPGVVNADITESGTGNVIVIASSGSYEGSIIENAGGNVEISVDAGVSFKGNVEEFGSGDVTADIFGTYEGNLAEYGVGNVVTDGDGIFKGNSEHQLPGTCANSIADFQGTICNLL